jgi:hypothetical protein
MEMNKLESGPSSQPNDAGGKSKDQGGGELLARSHVSKRFQKDLDLIILNPLTYSRKHRSVPWPFITLLFMIIAATIPQQRYVQRDAPMYKNNYYMMCSLFWGQEDCDYGIDGLFWADPARVLRTSEEFSEAMTTALSNYEAVPLQALNFSSNTLERYFKSREYTQHKKTDRPMMTVIMMEAEGGAPTGKYADDPDPNTRLFTADQYVGHTLSTISFDTVDATLAGTPFDQNRTTLDQTAFENNIARLVEVNVHLPISVYQWTPGYWRNCMDFGIDLDFDFSSRGTILMKMRAQSEHTCDTGREDVKQLGFLWVTAAICAWLHLVTILIDTYDRAAVWTRVKSYVKKNRERIISDAHLRTDLMRESVADFQVLRLLEDIASTRFAPLGFFHPLTHLAALAGDVILGMMFMYNFATNVTHNPSSPFVENFSALGYFCMWISLTEYFAVLDNVTTLLKVIGKSLVEATVFFGGLLPIILAYVVAGQILFAERSRLFSTFMMSLRTVFCLLMPDTLVDVFEDMASQHPVTGSIYVYTLVLLWVFVLVNVFLALVGDIYTEINEEKEVMQKFELFVRTKYPSMIETQNPLDAPGAGSPSQRALGPVRQMRNNFAKTTHDPTLRLMAAIVELERKV